ncbi:MAG: aminopeptidase P N-terminal domain-containing protein, partial [Myxococcota bacterium]
NRRREFLSRIGDQGVAIFVANSHQSRSADTQYQYRPSSDVLYLSGFREPEAVLVLAPDHEEGEFVMFVRDRDEKAELWNGRRAGPDGAKDEYGADAAFALEELDEKLPDFLEHRDSLYYTFGNDDDFDQKVIGWLNGLRHRRGKPPAAPSAIVDARDIVNDMRVVKTAEEIERMRASVELTAEAHVLAMQNCKPGIKEYELQALIEYHFRRNGAEYPAYESIVGAGNNATVLHYTENRDTIEDGDVVLIDAGAELEFYAGDITRSFPANGEFTPAQRDVYQAVLDAEIAAIEDVEPGLPYNELQERTVRRLTQSMVDLGLLDGSVDELIEEEEYKKYYPHKIGHWLGIDVHDVGPYYDDAQQWRALAPGMILTIEPGIYIPEGDESAPEEMRGLGIRIEDDILVTNEGCENLSKSCPKTIDEVEALVGSEVS